MHLLKKTVLIISMVMILMTFLVSCGKETNPEKVLSKTVETLQQKVQNPSISSIGGEWTVIALARSGEKCKDGYLQQYRKNVATILKKNNGKLPSGKCTELARVILALTAIGENADRFEGNPLTSDLIEYNNIINEGMSGAIFALLAADAGNYDISSKEHMDMEHDLCRYLLSQRFSDGGFSMDNLNSDPDVTAMALIALAKHRQDETVQNAVDNAITYLSTSFQVDGSFTSYGVKSSESIAQIIIALCELGVDPCGKKFTYQGKTLIDCLLEYYDDGAFLHTKNGGENLLATEEGCLALVAYKRFVGKQPSLYTMKQKTT